VTTQRRVALGGALLAALAAAWGLTRLWDRASADAAGSSSAAARTAAAATAATAAGAPLPAASRARRVSPGARDALAHLIDDLRARRRASAPDAAVPHEPSDEELDTVYIAEVLDELSPHVEACYSAARAVTPDAGGSLDLELTIDGEPDAGAILGDLRVIESSVSDPAFAACLLDTARTLALPAPLLGGRTVVRHGWTFTTHLRPDGSRIIVTSSMTSRP
jgi:hypothetical protein